MALWLLRRAEVQRGEKPARQLTFLGSHPSLSKRNLLLGSREGRGSSPLESAGQKQVIRRYGLNHHLLEVEDGWEEGQTVNYFTFSSFFLSPVMWNEQIFRDMNSWLLWITKQ